MADDQGPRTVQELRLACREWPHAVVRRAVSAVVPEPDAALVAAWLVQDDPPIGGPSLLPEAVSQIACQLLAQRH